MIAEKKKMRRGYHKITKAPQTEYLRDFHIRWKEWD